MVASKIAFCEDKFREEFPWDHDFLDSSCKRIDEVGREFGFSEVPEDQRMALMDVFGLKQEDMRKVTEKCHGPPQ